MVLFQDLDGAQDAASLGHCICKRSLQAVQAPSEAAPFA